MCCSIAIAEALIISGKVYATLRPCPSFGRLRQRQRLRLCHCSNYSAAIDNEPTAFFVLSPNRNIAAVALRRRSRPLRSRVCSLRSRRVGRGEVWRGVVLFVRGASLWGLRREPAASLRSSLSRRCAPPLFVFGSFNLFYALSFPSRPSPTPCRRGLDARARLTRASVVRAASASRSVIGAVAALPLCLTTRLTPCPLSLQSPRGCAALATLGRAVIFCRAKAARAVSRPLLAPAPALRVARRRVACAPRPTGGGNPPALAAFVAFLLFAAKKKQKPRAEATRAGVGVFHSIRTRFACGKVKKT